MHCTRLGKKSGKLQRYIHGQHYGPEKLVIFIVLNNKQDKKKLLTELNKLISKQLNPLFKIFELVVTRELPKTASHKIMRRELRRQFSEKPV